MARYDHVTFTSASSIDRVVKDKKPKLTIFNIIRKIYDIGTYIVIFYSVWWIYNAFFV